MLGGACTRSERYQVLRRLVSCKGASERGLGLLAARHGPSLAAGRAPHHCARHQQLQWRGTRRSGAEGSGISPGAKVSAQMTREMKHAGRAQQHQEIDNQWCRAALLVVSGPVRGAQPPRRSRRSRVAAASRARSAAAAAEPWRCSRLGPSSAWAARSSSLRSARRWPCAPATSRSVHREPFGLPFLLILLGRRLPVADRVRSLLTVCRPRWVSGCASPRCWRPSTLSRGSCTAAGRTCWWRGWCSTASRGPPSSARQPLHWASGREARHKRTSQAARSWS